MPEVATIVVPCHDEADRLDVPSLRSMLDRGPVRLLFVDDGSTDTTAAMLEAFAASRRPGEVGVTRLGANRGKAEAVRSGLRQALVDGASVVGYLDADLATPPEEMLRLVAVMASRPDVEVVLGSRVALMGRDIRRGIVRHWLGRIFATVASAALGIPVYDTQCGAKVFRRSPALEAALEEPFGVRWTFDVVLLARMLHPGPDVVPLAPSEILEEPLQAWFERPGSKLGSPISLLAESARMLWVVRRRRSANGIPPGIGSS